MNLDKFYQHAEITYLLVQHDKFQPLFEDVISRIPDEPEFALDGLIVVGERNNIIEWYKQAHSSELDSLAEDYSNIERRANCVTSLDKDNLAATSYHITIFLDMDLPYSNDCIKGLLVHEFSEHKHACALFEKESSKLKKMKRKARDIRIRQLYENIHPSSKQKYIEHEKLINQTLTEWGFSKELDAVLEALGDGYLGKD